MPKQKTHKGLAKRVKVTAKGKIKHRRAGSGHLLSGKNAKKRRALRNPAVAKTASVKTMLSKLRAD
jgi:large subunit ribosomal protein L35